MTDQLQRVDEQAERADERYEKLCKLEQIAREWIANRTWAISASQVSILRLLLKEAGLE